MWQRLNGWKKDTRNRIYPETNKAVQRKARAAKRAYLEDLADEAEEAARKEEQGKI